MMKRVFLPVMVLGWASLAFAQVPTVGVFADPEGTDCNLLDQVPDVCTYHVVVDVGTAGATGVQFSAPVPQCALPGGVLWIGDTPVFPVTLGNSQSGAVIGFGDCLFDKIHVLTMNFLCNGLTPPCCEYPVLADPRDTGQVWVVDCDGNLVIAAALTAVINGDPSCPCGASPADGACCYSDGTCLDLSEADCNASGGEYQGDGTNCAGVVCLAPAACCLSDGSCVTAFEAECLAQQGDYQGDGSVCDPNPCPQPPPPNDECEDAIGPLAVPSTTGGSTVWATFDGYPDCGTTITAPGVWYSVTGTGNTMTASTCNQADYDTKISVYCGECVSDCCFSHPATGCDDAACEASVCSYDSYCCAFEWDSFCADEAATDPNCSCGAVGEAMTCVVGDDDTTGCGLTTEVSWCSQPGVEYLILVHGFSSETGDFDLSISDDGIRCEADVHCIPAGGCCLPSVECMVTTEDDCLAQGGEYQGDDTDCSGLPPTDATITVEILTDNFGGETSWALVDEGGDLVAEGGEYASNTLYITDVGVYSDGCYAFTIFDSWGDGICCGWGTGYYSIYYNGVLVATGGEFGSEETVSDIGGCTGVPVEGGPGACCFRDGSCLDATEACCELAGGLFQGFGTSCYEGAGTPTVYDADPQLPIPDADTSGVTDTINVPDSFTIGDLNVDLQVTHTWIWDLIVEIEHNGVIVRLWNQDCGSEDDIDVVFDDEGVALVCASPTAGTFIPTEALAAFNGMDSAGDWTIWVSDNALPDPGTLVHWSLHIDEAVPPCPDGWLDIKPGSCPNPLNRKSKGVLPVAILGSADFDVTQLDVSTLQLARADGVGTPVDPNEGPPGPHSEFEDVGTPFIGDVCECDETVPDGTMDLTMKFRTQTVVRDLQLNPLAAGEEVELMIIGEYLDGAEYTSVSDCIVLVPRNTAEVRVLASAVDVPIEVTPLDYFDRGAGVYEFYRLYTRGAEVTLTAPRRVGDLLLQGWEVDGLLHAEGQTEVTLTLTGDAEARPVYVTRPEGKGEQLGDSALLER